MTDPTTIVETMGFTVDFAMYPRFRQDGVDIVLGQPAGGDMINLQRQDLPFPQHFVPPVQHAGTPSALEFVDGFLDDMETETPPNAAEFWADGTAIVAGDLIFVPPLGGSPAMFEQPHVVRAFRTVAPFPNGVRNGFALKP